MRSIYIFIFNTLKILHYFVSIEMEQIKWEELRFKLTLDTLFGSSFLSCYREIAPFNRKHTKLKELSHEISQQKKNIGNPLTVVACIVDWLNSEPISLITRTHLVSCEHPNNDFVVDTRPNYKNRMIPTRFLRKFMKRIWTQGNGHGHGHQTNDHKHENTHTDTNDSQWLAGIYTHTV